MCKIASRLGMVREVRVAFGFNWGHTLTYACK